MEGKGPVVGGGKVSSREHREAECREPGAVARDEMGEAGRNQTRQSHEGQGRRCSLYPKSNGLVLKALSRE